MNRQEMLAGLIAQAAGAGGDLVTLRAIVEEASELGAERVLHRMGLDDEHAHDDLSQLRQLLAAWRDAKRSAWRTFSSRVSAWERALRWVRTSVSVS